MVQLYNSTVPAVKVLILGMIFSMVVITVVNGGYLGLRYGKREPVELTGRVFQRSSNGVRNIQARSGERKFYPGTRFGGKRSSLPESTPIVTENGPLENQDLPSPNIPYDCFYIPFVGVRCTKPDDGYWNNRVDDERPQPGPRGVRETSVISQNSGTGNNPNLVEGSRNSF